MTLITFWSKVSKSHDFHPAGQSQDPSVTVLGSGASRASAGVVDCPRGALKGVALLRSASDWNLTPGARNIFLNIWSTAQTSALAPLRNLGWLRYILKFLSTLAIFWRHKDQKECVPQKLAQDQRHSR